MMTRAHFGWLLLAAVMAIVAATAASAAVTKTPYQTSFKKTCPTSSTDCFYKLPPVPANYRIEVSSVSCRLVADDNDVWPDYLQLLVETPTHAHVAGVVLVPIRMQDYHSGGVAKFSFAANSNISAFAPANHRFKVFLRAIMGHFSTLECHLSGQRVKLS